MCRSSDGIISGVFGGSILIRQTVRVPFIMSISLMHSPRSASKTTWIFVLSLSNSLCCSILVDERMRESLRIFCFDFALTSWLLGSAIENFSDTNLSRRGSFELTSPLPT